MSTAIIERPLNADEAAEFLGYSKRYLYQLVHQKRLTYHKPTGGILFFKKQDLESFLNRGRVAADYEVKETAEKLLNRGKK